MYAAGIIFQCPQDISNLGKRTEHGLMIVGQRLIVRLDSSPLFGPQRPAVEQGSGYVSAKTPETAVALE